MIGVLKADIAGTVVDRLNPSKIEQAGIVGGSGKAELRLLPEYRADTLLQCLNYFGIFAHFAGVHKIARLHSTSNGSGADGVFHCWIAFFGSSPGKAAVEHDTAFTLNRMRRLGKAFDRISR